MTQTPTFSHIIQWNQSKIVIEVLDPSKMEKEIIPLYFRHQKY